MTAVAKIGPAKPAPPDELVKVQSADPAARKGEKIPKPDRKIDPAPVVAKPAAKGSRASIAAAQYVSKEKLDAQGVNTSYKLKNGETVIFKPREEEAKSARAGVAHGTQWKREVAASHLADALGIKLVPQTAIVKHAGQTGSAMLFKEGFKTAHAYYTETGLDPVAKIKKADMEAWQLFDDLTNHQDRHGKNYMVKARADGSLELALIDNGLSNPDTYERYPWGKGKRIKVGLEDKPLSTASRASLERMIKTGATLRPLMEGLLAKAATDKLFERARTMLDRGVYGDPLPAADLQ